MPPTMTPPPKQPTKHHSPALPLEMSTAAYHHCLTQQQYYIAEGASPCTRMLELSLTSLTFPWLTTLMRRFLTASRHCRTPSNWIRSVQSFVQPVSLFCTLPSDYIAAGSCQQKLHNRCCAALFALPYPQTHPPAAYRKFTFCAVGWVRVICLCEAMKPCTVQVWLRGTAKSCAGQAALQRRQRRRCSQQPAPAHEPAK